MLRTSLALALVILAAGSARAQTSTATPAPAPTTATTTPDGDSDPDLDDLVKAVGLRPAQKLAVRKVIADAQAEFEAAITKLSSGKEQNGADKLEKIGEDISRRAQERIAQILDEKQRVLFAKYIREQEDQQRREEGNDEARPASPPGTDAPAPTTGTAAPKPPK